MDAMRHENIWRWYQVHGWANHQNGTGVESAELPGVTGDADIHGQDNLDAAGDGFHASPVVTPHASGWPTATAEGWRDACHPHSATPTMASAFFNGYRQMYQVEMLTSFDRDLG